MLPVVTVIPESEFLGEIHANTNRTILLCGITLVLAIASGLLTTRLIARPIRRLSQASSALAQGEWQENLSEESAIAEIQTLSISFNQMETQIRQSFEQVEQGNRTHILTKKKVKAQNNLTRKVNTRRQR